eukprot:1157906-Pelagomonas_calceolata.AAC.4
MMGKRQHSACHQQQLKEQQQNCASATGRHSHLLNDDRQVPSLILPPAVFEESTIRLYIMLHEDTGKVQEESFGSSIERCMDRTQYAELQQPQCLREAAAEDSAAL